MNIEANLRRLRTAAHAVTAFSILFLLAGLGEIGLGGFAVKAEYDRVAAIEELARQASPFPDYYGRDELVSQYSHSSTAYVGEARFLSAFQTLGWDSPAVIAALALLAAAVGLIVAAMFWVWRAHTNLARLRRGTKYSPAMVVAGYLVPGMNLLLPFEAMRELYNRSHGEPEELAHAAVDDVTAWWTAVVLGLLIFSAMLVKFVLDAGTNLIIMTPLWMEFAIASFAIILLLVSGYLFSRLARTITQAQAEYLPQIDLEAEAVAPHRPRVVLVQD